MKNHGVKWVSMMLMAGLVLGGCGAKNNAAEEVKGSEPAEKKIEFFQWKVEAVSFFDEKIKEFEAANPGVEIEQVNVPDGPAVLKTRVARGIYRISSFPTRLNKTMCFAHKTTICLILLTKNSLRISSRKCRTVI